MTKLRSLLSFPGIIIMESKLRSSQWAGRFKWWTLLLVLLVSFFVSGCVRSDLTLQFRGQSGGQIVEHLALADQVTAVSGATAKTWFNRIERQVRQLGGKTKRLANRELAVTIPFGTAADLEAKLNRFLALSEPLSANPSAAPQSQDPLIHSDLKLTQQNWLLLIRNRLSLDLDLRSLGVQSLNGEPLLSPDALLNLTFALDTPWAARGLATQPSLSEGVIPAARQQGKTLVWTLQPGQLNHLEAVFWYPSSVGIGAIGIALLVIVGSYLKYRVFSPPAQPTSTESLS